MNAYWLDFGRYNLFSEKGYESFGHLIIELPISLQCIPRSNEVDMTAILSENDMERLSREFDARWTSAGPRFYLSMTKPAKFEYPGPATLKTESGYEVWVTRKT
jgi:hypothetical protein